MKRYLLLCLSICLMTACGKMPEELSVIETEHTVIMSEEISDIEAGKEEAATEGDKESCKAPSKELVFEKREACLAGMSGDDRKRLTENIKTANLALEKGYLNDRLIMLTGQAKETHDVTYVREIYHIVHDMDYFLLRYAPEDVAPYVKDYGTIATYYGTLEVYR